MLIKHGAKTDIQDSKGSTPVDYAHLLQNKEVMDYLTSIATANPAHHSHKTSTYYDKA